MKRFFLTIFRPADNLEEYSMRFNIIHKKLKPKLIYPILKLIKKMLGKFILSGYEEIVPIWYNNHLRIMMKSYEEGLDDMWLLLHKPMSFRTAEKKIKARLKRAGFPENPTDKEYLEYCHQGQSHIYRKLIKQIEFTEILEDTIDRTYFDAAFLRMMHYGMKHYGISAEERKKVPKPGEFPVYDSPNAYHPEYFINNIDIKLFNEENIE